MIRPNREQVRRSHLFWHILFFALLLAIGFAMLRSLGGVLTPVVAALVIAYLLDPAVSWFERRLRFPRWMGTLVLFLIALVVLLALALLVLPVIVREIQSFAEGVPGYMQKVRGAVISWVEGTFNVDMPESFHELFSRLGDDFRALAIKAASPIPSMAGTVARGTASLFSTLGTLLLIPIFIFYFLPKFPAILRGAESLIPRRFLGRVKDTAREVDRVLAAWLRGQLTVAAILAVLYATGLTIVGVKMAVFIGLVTGMLSFIPYVGVIFGMTLAFLFCLLEYTGPGQMIGVGIVFGIVQATDGVFLTPFIVGETVGLGPVGVLLALLIGGHLFGFIGVLLAVPTAAALVVVLRHAVGIYKNSLFYERGAGQPATEAKETVAGQPEG